eukprot:CAMPEP_0114236696 /NCGR_PEP_ID=MMETSP0058-20121206/6984_1 /TAXON_ID=36894 /ORGANISM="Pyramimonas parkeae, CCMP726" /LENGTH=410 /DNA_ID=CAMNT_0001348667 /DNA_START=231 /DNA_END=1463 /DNA_ORIENTATION=+
MTVAARRIKGTPCVGYSMAPCVCKQGKLVTVLGKGGVGKSTAAIALSKHYAASGKRVLLVLQSEDRSAENLLGVELPKGSQTINVEANLDAVRVAGTELMAEPWAALQASSYLIPESFSGGTNLLSEVTAEELPILPGMDMFAVLGALRKFAMQYDTVVYDGPSAGEVLRLLGSPSRLQWYLVRMQSAMSKMDMGRVAMPLLMDVLASMLEQEAQAVEGAEQEVGASNSWGRLQLLLTRATSSFADPALFTAFLVTNPGSPQSVDAAQRMWAGAQLAGAHVGGTIVVDSNGSMHEQPGSGTIPIIELPSYSSAWEPLREAIPNDLEEQSRNPAIPKPFTVTAAEGVCQVGFFLPGLKKTEVRLTQRLANSEILVEACGQRCIVQVPKGFGKVTGAKFESNFLNVSLEAAT